jgi:hypothetical protein
VKAWFLNRFLGAYCPAEWRVREAHTDSVVRRASVAKAKSEKVTEMVKSYQDADERLCR